MQFSRPLASRGGSSKKTGGARRAPPANVQPELTTRTRISPSVVDGIPRHSRTKRGGAHAPPRFRHLQLWFELPGQLQAEFHVAASSIEKGLVQERRRGHENVAGIQRVGVIR